MASKSRGRFSRPEQPRWDCSQPTNHFSIPRMANYTKLEERRRSLLHLPDPPPPKRNKTPPGPVPTLADTARHFSWFWCRCANPCGHSAVIPVSAAIACVGPNAVGDDLARRLLCTKCGKRRPTFTLPSWGDIQVGFCPMPAAEMVAVGMLRYWDDIRGRLDFSTRTRIRNPS